MHLLNYQYDLFDIVIKHGPLEIRSESAFVRSASRLLTFIYGQNRRPSVYVEGEA